MIIIQRVWLLLSENCIYEFFFKSNEKIRNGTPMKNYPALIAANILFCKKKILRKAGKWLI
jgi:hypothetical protein